MSGAYLHSLVKVVCELSQVKTQQCSNTSLLNKEQRICYFNLYTILLTHVNAVMK